MGINESVKSRPDLKLYFVKNAIPTESNFADLIDSVPNQREDGFVKSSGEPLSIEAGGGASSQKRAINFYWNSSDDKPHWVLSLNPRARPSSAATAKQGFSISDAEGHSRLFIQPSGNVGVSTVSPAAKSDILGGRWDVSNTEGDLRVGNEQFRFKVGVALAGGGKGDVRLRAHGGTNRMMLGSGDADVLTISNGNVGIGTLEPKVKLHVNGPIHTTGEVRALGGVRVDGNLAQHVETDGAFYRHGGQVHINVDDNLYIRDTRRDNAFHFDTNRSILLAAGIRVDKTVAQHIEADGAFYRFGGQVYITVDDRLYIRDKGGDIKFYFDTNKGVIRQDNWQAPSLKNSWVNYSSSWNKAGFFKDRQGIVHLKGLVKGGNPIVQAAN